MRLVVSRAARGDLQSIARYTAREWGAAHKKTYLAAIRERFSLLRRRPKMGTPREDISPGYRSMPVGRHLVFYRLTREEIVILRILHQRMDATLHL